MKLSFISLLCGSLFLDLGLYFADVKMNKIGYILPGVACVMGFIAKGFLTLAVPILPWAIREYRLTELLRCVPLKIVVAASLGKPWALAINNEEVDFLN